MRLPSSFLLVLFLLPVVSAGSLQVSPVEVVLEGVIEEEVCSSVTLHFSSSNEEFAVEDWWSAEGGRDLKRYVLSGEDVGVSVLSEGLSGGSPLEVPFCVVASRPGDHAGVLLFRAEGSSAGVGVWLRLQVSGGVSEQPAVLLRGMREGSVDRVLFWLVVLQVLLLAGLLFLLWRALLSK